MKSLRELYRIGRGPSSSHTMAPSSAAEAFGREQPEADFFRAVLYGSLALTGRGHGTDSAIEAALAPRAVEVVFDTKTTDLPHPNTMDIFAYRNGAEIARRRIISTGGGAVRMVGEPERESPEVYEMSSFSEIADYCKARKMRLWEYVAQCEGEDIWDFLDTVWKTMNDAIMAGLSVTGELPGSLRVERKAQFLHEQRHIDESYATRENRIVCSYAFAAAEQNAAGGVIVTAPTCGSCGVVPAALRYMQKQKGFSDQNVLWALATGGLVGNIIKTNASISGAECGCQAEIGSACSMCAAALGELFELGIDQIEYAAEVAMEHHLGLTCDPIDGLVQIPCIERNAVAAMRAINALSLANFLTSTRKISFDVVVKTMYQTGLDMNRIYRETAEGGLARFYG